MSQPLRYLAVVAAVLISYGVLAKDRFVLTEARAPFCRSLLTRLNAAIPPATAVALPGAKLPSLTAGAIAFATPDGRKLTEAAQFATVDINNDGREELIA